MNMIESAMRDWQTSGGIARVHGFFPPEVCEQILTVRDRMIGKKRPLIGSVPKEISDLMKEARTQNYQLVSGRVLADELPEAVSAYQDSVCIISTITGLDLKCCQPPEGVSLLYYGDGGFMAEHSDGTKVTAMLYLSDNPDNGATVFLRNDTERAEYPKMGDMIVFAGPERHLSAKVKGSKTLMIWGYY